MDTCNDLLFSTSYEFLKGLSYPETTQYQPIFPEQWVAENASIHGHYGWLAAMELDATLALHTVTKTRMEDVSFSTPLLYGGQVFVYNCLMDGSSSWTPGTSLLATVRPLAAETWVLFALASALLRGLRGLGRLPRPALALAGAVLLSLLFKVYKANLSAVTVRPSRDRPRFHDIVELAQLVADGELSVAFRFSGDSVHSFIRESDEPELMALAAALKANPGTEIRDTLELCRALGQNRSLVAIVYPQFFAACDASCLCQSPAASALLPNRPMAFMFEKESRWVEKASTMIEMGIQIYDWKLRTRGPLVHCRATAATPPHSPMDLRRITGLFIILGCLAVLCAVAFVAEVVFGRRHGHLE